MKKMGINLRSSLYALLIFIAVQISILPYSPLFSSLVQRDSGVFSYIGWRIINGEIPYRDVWDHKPPLIFYLNALGQLLTPGSQWGIWIIQCLFLLAAAYLGFRIINKLFGAGTAIFSLFSWLLTFNFLGPGGNFTEEYALPFQFLCFYLVFSNNHYPISNEKSFLLGLLFAVIFFFKQTNIGIGMAIVVYFLLITISKYSFKSLLKIYINIFLGFITITCIICLYYFINGAIHNFWEEVFQFNFIYTKHEIFSGIYLMIIESLFLVISGLLIFSIIGYIAAIKSVKKKDYSSQGVQALWIVCLLDVPIEFLLIDLSGRGYSHYFVPLLPSLVFLAGLGFYKSIYWLNQKQKGRSAEWILTIFCLLIMFIGNKMLYFDDIAVCNDEITSDLVHEIDRLTSPNDSVLLIGNETAINYMAQRKSPTKYVYQIPLYQKGYSNPLIINDFLNDVLENRPLLLISAEKSSTLQLHFPFETDEINNEIILIQSRYQYFENIGDWSIYILKEQPANI